MGTTTLPAETRTALTGRSILQAVFPAFSRLGYLFCCSGEHSIPTNSKVTCLAFPRNHYDKYFALFMLVLLEVPDPSENHRYPQYRRIGIYWYYSKSRPDYPSAWVAKWCQKRTIEII